MNKQLIDDVAAALEARDKKMEEMLQAAIEVQNNILGVIDEQKSKQDSMLEGRVGVEQLILAT